MAIEAEVKVAHMASKHHVFGANERAAVVAVTALRGAQHLALERMGILARWSDVCGVGTFAAHAEMVMSHALCVLFSVFGSKHAALHQ